MEKAFYRTKYPFLQNFLFVLKQNTILLNYITDLTHGCIRKPSERTFLWQNVSAWQITQYSNHLDEGRARWKDSQSVWVLPRPSGHCSPLDPLRDPRVKGHPLRSTISGHCTGQSRFHGHTAIPGDSGRHGNDPWKCAGDDFQKDL